MAEIQIDRKRGPNPLVWAVAGLVVLALVIWGVMEMTGDDRRAEDDARTTPAAEQFPVEQQPAQPLPREEPYTPPAGEPGTGQPGGTTPGQPGTTAPGQPGAGTPGAGEPGTPGSPAPPGPR